MSPPGWWGIASNVCRIQGTSIAGPTWSAPAEQPQRENEAQYPPGEADAQLRNHRCQARSTEDVGPKRVDNSCERQRLDDRLNGLRKARGGEEHTGEDPHWEHRQVHQSRRSLDGLSPGGDQKSQRRKAEGGE